MDNLINKWAKQRIINSYTFSCSEQANCISLSVVTYFTIVQRNDSYIAKLQKKDEIITMLQKQLQKSNKPSECICVFMYIYRHIYMCVYYMIYMYIIL